MINIDIKIRGSDVEDNDTNDPGIGAKVRRDSLEMGLRKT